MAESLANLEKLYAFAEKNHLNDQTLAPGWPRIAKAIRNLIDDRTALYAACVAVSAVGGEATSKAITDAAITASDLLISA